MSNYAVNHRSFNDQYIYRDLHYRTPSPPTSLVEPISPLLGRIHAFKAPHATLKRKRIDYEPEASQLHSYGNTTDGFPHSIGLPRGTESPVSWATQGAHQAQTAASPLEALAAAATSPHLYQSFPKDARTAEHLQHPRHSKRTRSEVINYRPEISVESRPATSYPHSSYVGATHAHLQQNGGKAVYSEPYKETVHQISASDNAISDAELLLNFSRANNQSPSVKDHRIQDSQKIHDSVNLPPFRPPAATFGHVEIVNAIPVSAQHGSFLSPENSPKSNLPTYRSSSVSPPRNDHDAAAVPLRVSSLSADMRSTPRHTGTSKVAEKPTAEKSKSHRGWPKGKPRGTRTTGSEVKKTRRVNKRSANSARPARSSRSTGKEHREHFETEQYSYWDEIKDSALSKTARARSAECEPSQGNDEHNLIRHRRAISVGLRMTANRFAKQDMMPRVISKWRPKNTKSRNTSKTQRFGTTSEKSPMRPLSTCMFCGQSRNTSNAYQDLWISCNGCKNWFHTICVGFTTERMVKDIDKFHCTACEPKHGPTTFVRKSKRAHASVDYAGLHEGKMRTATDVVEHHYIEPIKDGRIEFLPETFPRMPPELVTAEYFERCGGMTEPILIPAALNSRNLAVASESQDVSDKPCDLNSISEDDASNFVYSNRYEDGQDKLDMVIPQDLTVRKVAELYGPEEKVEVIDVKSQEGEDKRWNMRQWAEYYEAEGEKPVRNVISLEVSQSLLGRLIRRPKIVRDLDLQDAVWPLEERNKDIFPRVQFYCLMSVADCYTDFHIDFGGSSVYYHILRGRKTFFFIPPSARNLKKYEEWCLSPNQNSTFLGHETNECYRVDLYQGDTMLIPSGWIHAVWTPENSLVIGGNFLTRMHYGMQITVNDIEKNTGVARKFRYPHFQKVLWHTLLDYLRRDPVPSTVIDTLCSGKQFHRDTPSHHEYQLHDLATSKPETFNSRYYSQAELDGLPDLLRYILRTVLISIGKVHGVSKSTQDAVVKSLPKGFGNHTVLLKTFAIWIAWKRGNESIPHWAYPDFPLADIDLGIGDRKLSAAEKKRMERQAAREAYKVSTERRPTRHIDSVAQESHHEASIRPEALPFSQNPEVISIRDCAGSSPNNAPIARFGVRIIGSPAPSVPHAPTPEAVVAPETFTQPVVCTAPVVASTKRTRPTTPNTKRPKGRACIDCRLSKRRCIHDEAGQIDPAKAHQQSMPRTPQPVKPFSPNTYAPSEELREPKLEVEEPMASLTQPVTAHVNLSKNSASNALINPNDSATPAIVEKISPVFMHSPWQNDAEDFDGTRVEMKSISSLSPNIHDLKAVREEDDDASKKAVHNKPFDESSVIKCRSLDYAEDHIQRLRKQETTHGNSAVSVVDTDQHGDDNRQVESSSRTPSLHVQSNSTDSNGATNSRPSSPLTEVDAGSPPQDAAHHTFLHKRDRITQFNLKRTPPQHSQADHLQSTNTAKLIIVNGQSPTHTRRASKASSPECSTSACNTQAGIDVKSRERNLLHRSSAASPVASVSEAVEDEDEKFARALMEQEFGLRRRRGT